ncbi:hypothetical protein MKX01_022816 [Papaver californicum]|nr:hypothetical protein MKX01_022816 [Papaver californicum]
MVDFEFNTSIRKFRNRLCSTEEHFSLNLSMLLQWSPYKTKTKLMKQFDDIGQHGIKIIIYNLWFTDDGEMEFDCESDAEDIRLPGAPKVAKKGSLQAIGQQISLTSSNYSLRGNFAWTSPNSEGVVVTTIGFLKEAPHVNIHGFIVYHKNKLIMVF